MRRSYLYPLFRKGGEAATPYKFCSRRGKAGMLQGFFR